MTIKKILELTSHRPWDLPKGKWKYYQEWNNTIFLHFQVDINELKKHIPEDLEIDLFEGKAYVSVVPFTMERIRQRNIPPFPPISNFNEVNIRTYVRYKEKTGVHFLSIEGGKTLSCWVAKLLSELPYRKSSMRRTSDSFSSNNKKYKDSLFVKYQLGNKSKNKSKLELWLTERYALFQQKNDSINEFEIHHAEWPTSKIHIQELRINYPRFNNLITSKLELAQYSKGVQVIAWGKKANKKLAITQG
tara:strand:- start:32 stop:772 length:741 start_codon:yes stop_codon:yes gene_type:complete